MALYPGPVTEVGITSRRRQAAPQGLGEEIAAGWEATRRLDQADGALRLRREEMTRRISGIKAATGKSLRNPYTDNFAEVDEDKIRDEEMALMRYGAHHQHGVRRLARTHAARALVLEEEIAALAQLNPDIETKERFETRVRRRAADLEEAQGAAGLGGFIGAVGGNFTDPINVMTLPFGASSKTILGAAVKEAGLNTAIEALMQPDIQANRRELGLSHGLGQAATNVAAAATFGAVFGGGVKGAGRLLSKVSRREVADAVDELPEDILTPEVVSARIDVEREIMPQEALGPGALPEVVETHQQAMGEVLARAEEGMIYGPIQAPEIASEAIPLPNVAGVHEFDPLTLGVDAKRFQFKGGGDQAGVSDVLGGITQFDPIKAGEILVWQDRQGRNWVADGHQRTGLARRLASAGDSSIKLRGVIIREADGIGAESARVIAASKNLAQGTGSAVDAAKILRVAPELLDGSLSPRTAMFRAAMGLKDLSDDAFGMIINDVVSPEHGAIVGRLVKSPAEQLSVLGVLSRASPATQIEAEALVRQAMAAGFSKSEQIDIFGSDVVSESLLQTRAAILAGAVSQLRRDKRLFGTLTRDADDIIEAGNQLNVTRNKELADNATEISEIVLRTAYITGPVSAALRAATELKAKGASVGGAKKQFINDLKAIGAAGLRDLDRGGNSAGRTGAATGLASPRGDVTGQASGLVRAAGASLEASATGPRSPQLSRLQDDLLDGQEDMLTGMELDPESNRALPRQQSGKELKAEIENEDLFLDRLKGCARP